MSDMIFNDFEGTAGNIMHDLIIPGFRGKVQYNGKWLPRNEAIEKIAKLIELDSKYLSGRLALSNKRLEIAVDRLTMFAKIHDSIGNVSQRTLNEIDNIRYWGRDIFEKYEASEKPKLVGRILDL